jgi:thymidylate synthase
MALEGSVSPLAPSSADEVYLALLRHIEDTGVDKPDRTGVGTRSVFGYQMRFDLRRSFPLLTTKKVHFKSVVYELLWFLQGQSNNRWLQERGVRIWNEWADQAGDLGPIYGVQWRSWPTPDGRHIDQISQMLALLNQDPNSRRLIVSSWNVAQLDEMALMPCHVLFQFYVTPGGAGQGSQERARLSCQLYQRSADVFLGLPFNIASYALLTHLVAAQCGLEVGEFIWTGGDCHLYRNHQAQVQAQLTRLPYPGPQLALLRQPSSLFDYQFEDISLTGYQAHPALPAQVAV